MEILQEWVQRSLGPVLWSLAWWHQNFCAIICYIASWCSACPNKTFLVGPSSTAAMSLLWIPASKTDLEIWSKKLAKPDLGYFWQEPSSEASGTDKAFQDVSITEAATMKADGKEFTAYTIAVCPGFDFKPWTVKRRFRYLKPLLLTSAWCYFMWHNTKCIILR